MVSSGCKEFDLFLGGGFPEGKISLIYGPSATGKTTICLQTALNSAKRGKVLFIDLEGGFSVERLNQMENHLQESFQNIITFRIKDFDQQVSFFKNLEAIVKEGEFALIIVDTIGVHYRKAVREENHFDINKEMIDCMRVLKHIVNDENIPIIITNQVYSDFLGGKNSVGGKMVKNFANLLIELEAKPRKAKMLKPEEKEFKFKIVNEGIIQL